MKKLCLTLIALSVLVMFTACANASGNLNASAVYKGTQRVVGMGTRIITHTYGNDGIMTINLQDFDGSSRDTNRGPYTGNPNEDGTLVVTLTEEKNSSGEWVAKTTPAKKTYIVKNGSYSAGITMTRQ